MMEITELEFKDLLPMYDQPLMITLLRIKINEIIRELNYRYFNKEEAINHIDEGITDTERLLKTLQYIKKEELLK